MERVGGLPAGQRELEVRRALLEGNVPDFQRRFRSLPIDYEELGRPRRAWVGVMVDYLAIGDDDDFVRVPVAAGTAQAVADAAGCVLPTRKIVDEVYRQADLRVTSPRLPNASMLTSSDYYVAHHEAIEMRRKKLKGKLGALVAGHKKDIVISRRLVEAPGHLAIYGWFLGDGHPIQPLSAVHSVQYVDYSHGVRLVHGTMLVNGRSMKVADALCHPELWRLVSDEGPVQRARY